MNSARALAPAKVNLGLFLGPTRAHDGRHELVSVMQSISLADQLTLEPAGAGADGDAGADEVICPGLSLAPGENLAARALSAFRAGTGWQAPPLRLSIAKHIPVAGGLGGGSADAAGALRLARLLSGLGDEALLLELAAGLGADVPAQVSPGRWLAQGAGERLAPLPGSGPGADSGPDPGSDRGPAFGVLVLPVAAALSTAAVYAEADRLGLAGTARELEDHRRALEGAWKGPAGALAHALAGFDSEPAELLHNDLQAAALSLCPQISAALAEARAAGAAQAFVSGSGPTVVGLFAAGEEPDAAALAGREPAAVWARPVDGAFGAATLLAGE
jgi:4-diphosphocytidyl-2-C-methyl-D-erythritol kinase